MKILIKRIQEVPQEPALPGVIATVALKPEETFGKAAKLTHLVVGEGENIKSDMLNEETIYFVLSGYAIVTVNLPHGSWDRELSANSAVWIPSGFTHSIKNNGEGPLRILQSTCNV